MDIGLRWFHWAIVAVLTLRVVVQPDTGVFAWLGAGLGAVAMVWAATMLVRLVRGRPRDAPPEPHGENA